MVQYVRIPYSRSTVESTIRLQYCGQYWDNTSTEYNYCTKLYGTHWERSKWSLATISKWGEGKKFYLRPTLNFRKTIVMASILVGESTVDTIIEDNKECRFCFQSGVNLISPCSCKGSAKYVHSHCLNTWRVTNQNPAAFTQCQSCNFTYRLRNIYYDPENRWFSRATLYKLFVAKDICLAILLTQIAVALGRVFITYNHGNFYLKLRKQFIIFKRYFY